ncbi:hypothetical protein G9F32_07985 [Acinetobacter sp. 194]|uniref:hypothetical protein n=1 Tax=Acinetobacter shaoyimingii TaxID=2715164 RepID=UPI001409A80A|nr:hypothetical protein [Acinetobacter shaoyimingii]NHB57966.1 hypothetical protein [Acinetobacter shaoyimingii]
MSSILEKQQFSQRLKQALIEENHPISPTYLSNEFNNRYSGQAISVQSANNWLTGKAIPNQDKLTILSIWLDKSAQWLRFGDTQNSEHSYSSNQSKHPCKNTEIFMQKFEQLNFTQKKLIQNLVDEFLK